MRVAYFVITLILIHSTALAHNYAVEPDDQGGPAAEPTILLFIAGCAGVYIWDSFKKSRSRGFLSLAVSAGAGLMIFTFPGAKKIALLVGGVLLFIVLSQKIWESIRDSF